MFPDREIGKKWSMDKGCSKGFACRQGNSFGVMVLAFVCFSVPNAHSLAQEETPEEKGLRIARETSAPKRRFRRFHGRNDDGAPGSARQGERP